MTLKTLNYIHQLLIEREAATIKAKKMVYEARAKAEEEEADNYKALCDAADRAWESYKEANDALRDFEDQDW